MSRRSSTSTKVFVGSLPPGTTPDELRLLFEPFGEISECDVVNRCGFLHLEDKALALRAIEDLNNTTFNGTRISVEKGRVKPPNRDRGGPSGGGGSRNGFGGPMRGGRDSYRGGPYMRDGDFDRRGPPRGGGGGYGNGGGYDRGFGNRQPMNDGYSNGGDRRPYMDDRSGYGDSGYGDTGYGMGGGGGDMYPDDYSSGYPEERRGLMDDHNAMGQRSYDRRPMIEDRKPLDDRAMLGDRRPALNDRSPGMMDERRPLLSDRRPLLDAQAPTALGSVGLNLGAIPSLQSYDRRPADMYSRRDVLPKPMGGGGGYGESPRNAGYETGFSPMQQRGFAGGPGPRRDMPPARRF